MQRNRRCPFTEVENRIILEGVQALGEDWIAISKKLTNRTPKQCHDRYYNYLRDGLKKEPWTKEEDEILVNMFKEIGPKWSKMMNQLPGRSGNDIKNRWHKHLIKGIFPLSAKENKKRMSLNANFPFFQYSCLQSLNQLQMPHPQAMPIQVDSQMNPLQSNINNNFYLSSKCSFYNPSFQFLPSKQKKASTKVKNSMKNLKCQPQNLNVNNTITFIDKIEINENVLDALQNQTYNQTSDLFSSILAPDIDIQEFLDCLGKENIDDFPLL